MVSGHQHKKDILRRVYEKRSKVVELRITQLRLKKNHLSHLYVWF